MTTKLITGLQGEGKTHLAMKWILEAVGKRPVYTNIDGCRVDGVLDIPMNEEGELDWQLCERADPDLGTLGALVIYDEAQKLKDTPTRPTKPPEKYFAHKNREKLSSRLVISELDEHRHFGYDIVFLTQDPNLLHAHLLSLCKEHYHCSRPLNKKGSQVAFWRSVQKNPNSPSAVERAEDVFFQPFQDEIFALYKSTDAVTDGKVRIPGYMYKLGAIAVVAFLISAAIFANFFFHFGDGHRIGQDSVNKALEAQKQLEAKSKHSVNDSTGISPELQNQIDQCVKQFGWSPEMCREGLDKEYLETKNKQLENKTGNSIEQIAIDYNPSKPFDAVPQSNYQATTMPVFSGCTKFNNRYQAYTQQGTKLDVSQSDCERLIKNNDRPFNYFANNQQAQRGEIKKDSMQINTNDLTNTLAQTSPVDIKQQELLADSNQANNVIVETRTLSYSKDIHHIN